MNSVEPLPTQPLNKTKIPIAGLHSGASGQDQAALPKGLEKGFPESTSGIWDYANYEWDFANGEGTWRKDISILDIHTGGSNRLLLPKLPWEHILLKHSYRYTVTVSL